MAGSGFGPLVAVCSVQRISTLGMFSVVHRRRPERHAVFGVQVHVEHRVVDGQDALCVPTVARCVGETVVARSGMAVRTRESADRHSGVEILGEDLPPTGQVPDRQRFAARVGLGDHQRLLPADIVPALPVLAHAQ